MINLIKRILLTFLFCFLFLPTIIKAQDKWRDVSQDELQMKAPKVEADAEAEAILWEVRVMDDYVPRAGFKSVLNHYLRIKIFNERGRENNSKVDIPFGRIPDLGIDIAIKDISARTIKPDGTIFEVKPNEIFERETVKGNGVKLKAKSFAMPGIEVGAIVEYRWKEIRADSLSYYLRMDLSREIPIQQVNYYIKPVSAPGFHLAMRIHSMNVQNGFTKDKDDFYKMTMSNVPADREESRMPSEYDIRPWMLVYYADPNDDTGTVEKYWAVRSKAAFDTHKSLLKPTDEIRRIAEQLTVSVTDPEEKIKRVFEYCHRNIKNIDDDASPLTAEQRRDFKPNSNTSDTLKRRAGTWHDISMLFGAILTSLGIDARVANVALRSDAAFDKGVTNDFFVRTEIMAAKVGNDWRFFDLSSSYLPYGMLSWAVEGQTALISDEKAPVWVKTPLSKPELSQEKRTARLRLNKDGSLEGDVKIEYTGHLAGYHKEFNDDYSPSKRDEVLTQMVKRDILATAEVGSISVENVRDMDKPFVYAFKVRLPAYAERTGKRFFLRPNIFERNTSPLFSSSSRRYDVSFDYAWSEDDQVTIELPEGFSLESSEKPQSIKNEEFSTLYQSEFTLSDDGRLLTYRRQLSFGGNAALSFPKSTYSPIKQLFDSLHSTDSFAVSLKEN